MALTKEKLAKMLHRQDSYTTKQCADMVDSVFEIIKESLENGEDVMISGFGKFQTKVKDARKGRNPHTGEGLMLGSRKVVTFKWSAKLRKSVNP